MTPLILTHLTARITGLRRDLTGRRDDGYTVETIAVIALLVALAIGVVGVISVKVLAKAKSIDLNG